MNLVTFWSTCDIHVNLQVALQCNYEALWHISGDSNADTAVQSSCGVLEIGNLEIKGGPPSFIAPLIHCNG